ncbi:carbon starvation protein CstA [Marvinbryantia formatexigens DSM 14469]|uniref:Carbon starvation protein CstA n=1 Tax=Marvinbryantia formatexigens DSM 14469 TaxID=478749 RepID=C6LHF8_9FIRM|nr:carbon starvation protein A [Marvinbryantia formatexigens]EET59945.1 carbon starvation protein CstA [Marvinbryantia formatexigens DSM 14469]UWO25892.1 carbon starvation protein A [Marvinbryantia formatexigens DSM 14469]SDF41848.1 carbon starvation protein [Marvinbryantia formatexigens]
MNAALLLIVGVVILVIGYVTYGKWLADQWGVDDKRVTPAHELEDGNDYVPAKAPVLMGHHFSSIAGAGPINGPIQAAVFGWVPVMLWVLIGGIFFGAVHDFGALFASIRNKGQSIGEVIATSIGSRAKKLFLIFSYLTLILVVAAFASIVANTFKATYDEAGVLDMAASAANARTAMISILFIVIAIIFGIMVYRRNASLVVSTVIGVAAIIACMAIGYNWHPFYLNGNVWMVIVGIYIAIASVTPVWILLQPRDYLSSFLLYGMMIIAVVGILGAHPSLEIPAFTGFIDTAEYGVGSSLGSLFPALFVTIACGAISGFHSLVGSGTTAKQLDKETDARPIAYGGMLIECALALISLCAVGYIWKEYVPGGITTPTAVFATGISRMCATIPFLAGAEDVIYSMLILAVSAFCLTSLDTATRLARYMFQEFWLEPGQTYKDATGIKKTLTNPYVATIITVVLGIALGMTGYAKIWALFGAANQLLAALGLLAVAAWLGKMGKNNKMFLFPMAFMLVVTIVSLIQTIITNVTNAVDMWNWIRAGLGTLLVVLAVVLAIEGVKTITSQAKAKR